MQRREFLAGGAAVSAWAGLAQPGVALADADDLKTAAREAWVYSLSLVEIARLRAAMIGPHPTGETPGFNSYLHQRRPATPAIRDVSAPETGMLTSVAWVNLTGGAAKFRLPRPEGRYLSVALLDMYGDTLQVLGRKRQDEGGEFTVLGPEHKVGMAGYYVNEPRLPPMPTHKVHHAPGPWLWAVARVEAAGEGDLQAAHEVQDGLEIRVKGESVRPAPSVPIDADWTDYFFAAQKLIEENPPPPGDLGFFRRIAQLQLGMDAGFEKARFADMDLSSIAAGVGEGRTLTSNARLLQATSDGWMWPKADLGDYGQDYLYRAQTTLATPGAPPPDELLTLRAVAPDGGLAFQSAGHYRLSLPGPPPSDGPWSLTLYEVTPQGRLFLPDGAAGRFALGSHTPGLRQRGDGALDIWIGRNDPGGARSATWLQTPAHAPFAVVLRAYRPTQELLQHRWRPLAVEALGPATPAGRRRAS